MRAVIIYVLYIHLIQENIRLSCVMCFIWRKECDRHIRLRAVLVCATVVSYMNVLIGTNGLIIHKRISSDRYLHMDQ